MSMFLSFLGGAAEQLTTDIKQAELDAKEMAKSSFNGLYKRYEENAAANRELTNKMKAEKQYIETVWSNATPEQVNALIANPVALDAIKKAKNPESIDLKNYINVISSNESTATGAERAAMMPEIKAQIMAKMKEAKAPEGGSPIGALIRETGQQRMESDMEKYAKGQGMTLEQLRAGAQVKRPAETAKFNMGVLNTPADIKEAESKLAYDLFKAKESNDQPKVDALLNSAANIAFTNAALTTKNKSEKEIQTEMINDIQKKSKEGDKQGALTATALLRQRQALEALPKKEGQTDADKITQNNYITVANSARTKVIEKTLPPGTFITNTDAQGNVTTVLRDLNQADLFRKGEAIAANSIIKEMAKPDGTPLSDKHKNAMMSVGIMFDDNGKAIRPPIPEIAPKVNTPSSTTRGGPIQRTAPAQPAAPAAPAQPAAPVQSAPRKTIAPTVTPTLRWNPDKQAFE